MARKKTSRPDKTDAPESAAEDVTPPSAEAQDTPEAETAPPPDDASGTDSVEASGDTEDTKTPSGEAVEDISGFGTEQPLHDASDPDTVEASEDTKAPETPSDGTAQNAPEAEVPQQADVEDTQTQVETEATPEADHEPDPDTPPDDTEETPPESPPDEPAPETEQNTADATPVVRTEQVTVRQGGFWSMLIGGIAAAGIGVAAAPYIRPYLPVNGPVAAPPDNGLAARLDEQAQRLSDLGARLDGLPAPTDPGDEVAGLKNKVGRVSETLTDLTERVANLEVQVSNLAVRPAPEAPDTSATDAALDDLRNRLAAQGAEIEGLRATLEAEENAARDSARATLQRAALTRLMTALDTGEDFAAALTDLRDTGATVPDVLENTSQTGVPTHAQLVESFPDAARAALGAADAADTGSGASVGGFLRAQLGIRSLEPREGNDPDAILSRAEAALADGRLEDSLSEINTLPEEARTAMSGWATDAAARRDALTAAEALSAELN